MRGVGNRWQGLAAVALAWLLISACTAPTPQARSPGAPAGVQAAAAGASGEQSVAAAPMRVRSAYSSISGSILPAWIARDEGLFEKHGLDVELIYIAGEVKVAEALVAGEMDVTVSGGVSAIGPNLEGADVVMISSWTNKLSFSLVVPPTVQSVGDLRGKRLGIVRRGSNSEVWGTAVLARFGLEPERDYTFAAVGGQPEQVAALQNGAIEAAIVVPPYNLIGRKLGFYELLNAREYGLEFANVGLVTNRRYLREQREVVDRYLRATAEGVAILLQQPDLAAAVLARYTQVDERDLLDETVAFEQSRTSRDMMPTSSGIRAALEQLTTTNPKAATANPDDMVDLGPIRRLNESGFVSALYR